MPKLLQFSVGNYRSFHNLKTFTFQPTSIKDTPTYSVFCIDRQKLSTVSAIYGANSSGKSNFIDALAAMTFLIRMSVKLNDDDSLPFEPFLLSSMEENPRPTFFEAVFFNDRNEKVRYGFEYNQRRIEREWLFIDEKCFFVRDYEGVGVNETEFPEGVNKEEMTNDNRLFLSLVAQTGGVRSKEVIAIFTSNLKILSGLESRGYQNFTKLQFRDKNELASEMMRFFNHLELGFNKIEVREQELDFSNLPMEMRPNNPERIKELRVFSGHHIYNEQSEVIGEKFFNFEKMESKGTQKLFSLAGPIYSILKEGGILLIDELDAKMHPIISQEIVRLFVDEKYNPLHAQLIFTTHDTNLLAANLLRRDQIWFTEKNEKEETDLYRLTDIILPDGSKPRGDGNLERNYIKGRYGAIPFIRFE